MKGNPFSGVKKIKKRTAEALNGIQKENLNIVLTLEKNNEINA